MPYCLMTNKRKNINTPKTLRQNVSINGTTLSLAYVLLRSKWFMIWLKPCNHTTE